MIDPIVLGIHWVYLPILSTKWEEKRISFELNGGLNLPATGFGIRRISYPGLRTKPKIWFPIAGEIHFKKNIF